MPRSNQFNPEIESVAAEIMRHRFAVIDTLCNTTIGLEPAILAEDARIKASLDAAAALSVSAEQTSTPENIVSLPNSVVTQDTRVEAARTAINRAAA